MCKSFLSTNFDYGSTDNNGNILSQQISFSGLAHSFNQTYTYDSLNRLKSATETQNNQQTWKQTFTFDRYGNRRFDAANTTTIPKNCGVPQNPTVCPEDVARLNPSVNPTNNRLSSPGWQYDAAGNTTRDAENRRFTYDGENKQVKVETVDANGNPTATIGQYFFDGDGKRVKKVVPAGVNGGPGETTVFVYDASAKLLAEYSTIVEPQSTAKISYLTNDHLGSPRILTDAVGQVTSRRDFAPFGEELGVNIPLSAGTGGQPVRNPSHGYIEADPIRRKFTGYERDIELDLDYAKARYYNSAHGRYTGVDPMPILKRHLFDPRDFNRYAYVANNPLKYIDPTGEEKIVVIVRTYIPAQTVGGYGAAKFKGDYDETGKRISHRTEQRIVIETDSRRPNANNFDHFRDVGTTRRIARGLGSVRGPSEAQSDGSTLKASVTRRNHNTVNVHTSGNEANPLVPGSPGISYHINVTVQSDGADGNVRVSVSGTHDGFPAYEVIIQRPESGNTSTTVYTHNPNDTNQTPASLFPPEEFEIKQDERVIAPESKRRRSR